MKVVIDIDERFPDYSLTVPGQLGYPRSEVEARERFSRLTEIPDDKVDWIKKAIDEYEEVQEYLGNLMPLEKYYGHK